MKNSITDLVALGVHPAAATAAIAVAAAVGKTIEREADALLKEGRTPAYVRQYVEARREQLNGWLEAEMPSIISKVGETIAALNDPDAELRADVEEMLG